MAATADRSKPYIPLAGGADDGWSTDDEATATCFCGAVQLSFPTQGPGLVKVFVCNCADCHKITASMFATNFTVLDTHLKHLRGQDNLTAFGQSRTPASGKNMTNYFCSTCGTLMYRVGELFPGMSILRVGTVDDFNLHATKLKPQVEQYVKDRVEWLHGAEGVPQAQAFLHTIFSSFSRRSEVMAPLKRRESDRSCVHQPWPQLSRADGAESK